MANCVKVLVFDPQDWWKEKTNSQKLSSLQPHTHTHTHTTVVVLVV